MERRCSVAKSERCNILHQVQRRHSTAEQTSTGRNQGSPTGSPRFPTRHSRSFPSHEGTDERQIDSSHEAGWWNPRHCDRMCGHKIGQDLSTAVHEGVRVRMRPLSTRAGTDCVEHVESADPQATILSVDGLGAYDHVLRSTSSRDSCTCPQPRPWCPSFDCPTAPFQILLGGR